jgi:formylglycine-generating enzyme required for sulfatase activity
MKSIVFILIAAAALARAGVPSAPEGMVLVPAGDFTMGSDEGLFDEAPAHRVRLSAYYIDRCTVTNAEFAAYVRASDGVDSVQGPWFRFSAEGCLDLIAHYERRYRGSLQSCDPSRAKGDAERGRMEADRLRWTSGVAALRVLLGSDGRLADRPSDALAREPVVRALMESGARLPVRAVTWHDAAAYAHWAGKRLPTEAEWEKAARGTDARTYPWGSAWDPTRCRAGLGEDAGPEPVGSYPSGASPYGCLDMAGNVWEWCADWYGESYYSGCEGITDPQGPAGLANGELPAPDPAAKLFRESRQGRESDTRKVVRGGCWAGGAPGQTEFNTRCSRRLWSNPDYWPTDTGFRCARDLP